MRKRLSAIYGQQLDYSIPGPGQFIRTSVEDRVESIAELVERMSNTVRKSIGDPLVIETARFLVQSCPPKDKLCEMSMIDAWLREHTRYINDPIEKEAYKTGNRMIRDANNPEEALSVILGPHLTKVVTGEMDIKDVPPEYRKLHKLGIRIKAQEDCEGLVVLFTAMIGAAGIRPRFILGGRKEGSTCVPYHVWTQGLTQDGWVDSDITEVDKKIGWYFKGFDCFVLHEIFR